MAKRFTDTKKWDDDWFYLLEPRFKLAWIYLCDYCEGSGVWKVNLPLLSSRVGAEISREDFAKAFEPKAIWLSPDRVWFPSFITFQFKSLKSKNRTHRAIMRQLVEETAGLPLAGDPGKLVDQWKSILAESDASDPQLSLVPLSHEGQETPAPGSKEKVKVKGKVDSSEEEGTGEKGRAPVPPMTDLDKAEAAWRAALAHHKLPRDPRLDLPTLGGLIQRWTLPRLLNALAGFRTEQDSPGPRPYSAARNCVLSRLQKPESFVRLETAGEDLLAKGPVSPGSTAEDEVWE